MAGQIKVTLGCSNYPNSPQELVGAIRTYKDISFSGALFIYSTLCVF